MVSETLSVTTPGTRFSRAKNLIVALVSFHTGLVLIAVGGAAVFAMATVASTFGVQQLVDRVIIPAFETDGVTFGTWLAVSALVVLIALVRAAGVVVRRSYAGISQWTTERTIVSRVVNHTMRQPASWHRARMTGDISARMGTDSDAAVTIMGPLPFASSVVVLLVVASTWLLATDLALGLFAVAVMPAMLAFNLAYQRSIDRYYRLAQDELGNLSEAAHESFDGVLIVKAFGAEDRETERLAMISRRLQGARTRAVTIRSGFEAVIDATPSLVNVAVIALGALRIRGGSMTIGELSSFVYLFTLVSMPLRIVSYLFSELPHSLSGWDRVQEVLREPLLADPRAAIGHSDSAFVQLQNVCAEHVAGSPALRDVTLRVERGRTVAVVGATGAGKTTLLHVIAGLVPAASGEVRLGTRRVGLVFQEAFLFAESLRYNLTLGAQIPDAQVARALEVAAAAGFIADLGVGLDTELGERGVSLSGGQRQRLALARAIAVGSDLLLLDDTTSALDPTTEETVLRNLRDLHDSITTVVVASRPSTIALADEVVFMHEGRVAAVGTHDALLRDDHGYAALIAAFEHDRTSAQESRPR
jgi:ABC-type multidrug transport system fused ATPase/permease subunit